MAIYEYLEGGSHLDARHRPGFRQALWFKTVEVRRHFQPFYLRILVHLVIYDSG